MSVVTGVKPNPKKPDQAYIVFDDGTEAWCPEGDKAKALVIGQPLPSDWRTDIGDYGPRAFPPKQGGGGGGKAAFKNTKEGMLAEQDSIHRSVALEWAVTRARDEEAVRFNSDGSAVLHSLDEVLRFADQMYNWLSRSPGGSGAIAPAFPTAGSNEQPVSPPTAKPPGDTGNRSAGSPLSGGTADRGGEPQSHGEASGSSPGQHTHDFAGMEHNPLREMCVVDGCGLTRKRGAA